MDPLTDPTNVGVMRAAPAVAPQRDDFTQRTSTTFVANCQLYHTLPPPAANPGPAPAAPVAPAALPPRTRGRPSQARLTLQEEHAQATTAYQTALAAHPAALAVHAAALAAYNAQAAPAVGGTARPADRPDPEFIFTHGRGSRLDNPAVIAFAQGFTRTDPILCFEDTNDMMQRTTTFRSLALQFPSAIALGGRSMGARAACRAQIYSPIRKLIFFTYPLTRGLDERYEEPLALEASTDVLFILGDSDPMCHELHLKAIRERMRARTWWIRLLGADHAIWYDDAGRRDTICNVAGQIAAQWNVDENRDPALTELTLGWDAATQQVRWTGWMAPPAEPERPNTRFNINVLGGNLHGGSGNFTFSLPG